MVYESMHKRRLQTLGIRIVTAYYDGGVTKRRSSDGTLCDDVENGVILDKTYELDGKTALRETEYNPGILYSFVYPETTEGKLQCPSCGGVAGRDDFSEGCPYCGAAANCEYAERKAGERDHADYVVDRSPRSVLWLLLCIVGGIAVCMPLTVLCSRTALLMDWLKGAGVGLLLGLLVFIVRQFIVSRIDIRAHERVKQQRQNSILTTFQKDLADAGLTVKTFHNGLSAELNQYFYASADPALANVADYDLLDISNQKVLAAADGRLLSADIRLRIVTKHGDNVGSELTCWHAVLRHEDREPTVQLHGGLNMIECPNCGAKLNVEEPVCRYCGSPVKWKRLLTLRSMQRLEDKNA